jgi:hypothetical protein
VKFAFIKKWRHIWSVGLLCSVMQVTARGFRKWLARPMCRRQRGDMKVLVHIREQYGLSLGSYAPWLLKPRWHNERQVTGTKPLQVPRATSPTNIQQSKGASGPPAPLWSHFAAHPVSLKQNAGGDIFPGNTAADRGAARTSLSIHAPQG